MEGSLWKRPGLGRRLLVGYLLAMAVASGLAVGVTAWVWPSGSLLSLPSAGTLGGPPGGPLDAAIGHGGRLALLGIGLVQLVACLVLLRLVTLTVVQPLRATEAGAVALGRGELQRPLGLSPLATAELRELQLAWEDMRRALITKLRSSTELNLQLESEVARRSAELSRRNSELSEALDRLRQTRDELLRTEKLATVGRIAASVTGAISEPTERLARLPASLLERFIRVESELTAEGGGPAPVADPARRERLLGELAAMDVLLAELLASGLRVRDIVRAMRVYARPAALPSSPSAASPDPSPDELDAALRILGAQPPHALDARDAPDTPETGAASSRPTPGQTGQISRRG